MLLNNRNGLNVGKNVNNTVKDAKNNEKPGLVNRNVNNKNIVLPVLPAQDILTGEAVNDFTTVTRKRANKRNITIIGDSIIKDVKSFKLNKSIPSTTKVYVKSFSGATSEDMKTFVKPSLKFKPDLWILHTGTNDLRSEAKPAEIADNIIQLAVTLKSEENEVAVSSIVERGINLTGKGLKWIAF